MISEIKPYDLPLNLNTEINEVLEKARTQMTQNQKDQKDKHMIEIFSYFLLRLSTKLNDSEPNEITDLILDKSIHISEVTSIYDWPAPELLKVSNLHKMTVQFYNYIKNRTALICAKNKKHNKDLAAKACDQLTKFLIKLYDEPLLKRIENNLLYVMFKDIFTFYSMSGYKAQSKEEISVLIDLCMEDTNINGLAKMDKIDPTAEMQYIIGSLCVILNFKIELVEKKDNIHLTNMKLLCEKYKNLQRLSYFASAELVWLYTVYKFTKNELDVTLFKTLKDMIDLGRVYTTFVKSTGSRNYDMIGYLINALRTLMVVILVEHNVRLSEHVLSVAMYENYEMEMIINASRSNISPIKKMLKMGINSLYNEFKFGEKIFEILKTKKDIDYTKANEYRRIVLGIDKEQPFNVDESEMYLHNVLIERNNKLNELYHQIKI
jgi:hypothetical protein